MTEERLNEPFDEVLYIWRRARPIYERAGAEQPRGALAGTSRFERFTNVGLLEAALGSGGSSRTAMVELKGFEPFTSAMRMQRSTK